jgi:uncharacterized protein
MGLIMAIWKIRIVWDEPKRLATLAARGLDFARLDAGFFEAATISLARNGRFRAVGPFSGWIVAVIFLPRPGDDRRVSMRRQTPGKERA